MEDLKKRYEEAGQKLTAAELRFEVAKRELEAAEHAWLVAREEIDKVRRLLVASMVHV